MKASISPKKNLLFYLIFFIITSCGSSRYNSAMEVQVEALKKLVEQKEFTIESDEAYPRNTFAMNQIQNTGLLGPGNTVNRISLIGNPNFLTVKKDSVESQLPYFGERQAGSSYSLIDIGIDLNSEIKDYESEWESNKSRYVVRFRARSKDESYRVILFLYPNLTSSMSITGTKRFSIEYRGQIKQKDPEL